MGGERGMCHGGKGACHVSTLGREEADDGDPPVFRAKLRNTTQPYSCSCSFFGNARMADTAAAAPPARFTSSFPPAQSVLCACVCTNKTDHLTPPAPPNTHATHAKLPPALHANTLRTNRDGGGTAATTVQQDTREQEIGITRHLNSCA
jgi:hypothetical protein